MTLDKVIKQRMLTHEEDQQILEILTKGVKRETTKRIESLYRYNFYALSDLAMWKQFSSNNGVIKVKTTSLSIKDMRRAILGVTNEK